MTQVQSSSPIFKRTVVAITQTNYYLIKESGALVSSFQISWYDATSAFTAELFSSNHDDPTEDANLAEWQSEATSVPIIGAVASAAGSVLKHVGNNGAKNLLLKIVTTAESEYSIHRHGKE